MKPSIGRIVFLKGYLSNGTDEHPAVITRVWSDFDPAECAFVYVNLTVFPDFAAPVPMSSVRLFESRGEMEKSGHVGLGCFWPERVQ